MTENEEKKRRTSARKTWAHSAPDPANTAHLKIIREWKGFFYIPIGVPSTCLPQQMINLEFRNVCSLFSLKPPRVVTPDPTRSPERL